MIGADVSEIRNELSTFMREIKSSMLEIQAGVQRVEGKMTSIDSNIVVMMGQMARLLSGSMTKQELLAEAPAIDSSKLVWTAESQVVGRGGFGVVYQGSYGDEQVAIKTLKDNANVNLSELLTEIAIHSKLNDIPGVIRLYGVDVTCPQVERRCIVMELAKGSLHDALHNIPRFPVIDLSLPAKLALMVQVAATMERLHEMKVLHRDIKPANILLCMHGSKVSAKLSDFGLAKSYVDNGYSTMANGAKGTEAYMAPELRTSKFIFGKYF